MYDIAPIESPAGTLRTGQLVSMILFSYITLIICRVNTSLPPPTALCVTTSTGPDLPPPPPPPPPPPLPQAARATSEKAASTTVSSCLIRIMVRFLLGLSQKLVWSVLGDSLRKRRSCVDFDDLLAHLARPAPERQQEQQHNGEPDQRRGDRSLKVDDRAVVGQQQRLPNGILRDRSEDESQNQRRGRDVELAHYVPE